MKIWVEIFLRISWYNLKIISPAKLLVDKSVIPTGRTILFNLVTILLEKSSSESPNKRNATVDLKLLQVYLQISFVKTLTDSL